MKINKENLLKLASYLENLPDDYEHFDMSVFNKDGLNALTGEPHCGTVACAIGHTPYVEGLDFNLETFINGFAGPPFIDWEIVSSEIYGLNQYPENDYLWDWCFSEEWADLDNTPKGAAQRIKLLVANAEDTHKSACIAHFITLLGYGASEEEYAEILEILERPNV